MGSYGLMVPELVRSAVEEGGVIVSCVRVDGAVNGVTTVLFDAEANPVGWWDEEWNCYVFNVREEK